MKFLRRFAVAALFLGLLGCFEGERDDTEAPAASPEQTSRASVRIDEDQPFAFQRISVEEDAESPTLCLHFTEALDPAADYEPFVAIDRRVALSASGQRLCIAGLDYGETAKLTLREGLPSADGEALEADETVSLTFDDRPPVVRFAGNGVVLPRQEADGLAVTTVNVAAVDVRISRLNDRALVFKRITEGFASPAGEYAYEPWDEQPGDLGSAVYEGELVTEGPVNAVVTTLLPIGRAIETLEPGAYYVEITDAAATGRDERRPAKAARWIIVTDLAMTAYRGSSGLDITVRSIDSARPVRNAEVRLVAQSNEVLATARSDRDGRVHFDAPLLRGENGDRPKLITAEERDGDFALLDLDRAPLDLSSQPVGGQPAREGVSAFLYLDRGIYRPGETVHASVLLRDAAGYAAEGQPGALVLYRPNGLEQTRHRFERLEQAGSLIHDFALPEAASRGVWRIAMELDGAGPVGTQSFSVEDFVPQRLALDLEVDDETAMEAGETRMIEARLRFLYGAPGAGLTVDGTARVEEDPSPFDEWDGFRFGLHDEPFRQELIQLPEATTDGAGVASLPLKPGRRGAASAAPLRLRTVVRAEEPGGRAIQDDVRIPYRPRPLYLGVKSAFDGSAERGEPVAFEAVALDRQGNVRETEIGWRIIRRDFDYDWYQDEGGSWQWRRSERVVNIAEGAVVTRGDGAAPIEGPELPWGDYALILSADGEDLSSTGFWVGYGGRSADGTPAPDSVRVLGPDDPVRRGEDARIAIQAPYPGRAEVAVATGGILSLQHVEVGEDGAEITVPVTEEWGAGAYVLVSVYTDRDPDLRPVPRRAVGAAYVPVAIDERTFDVSLELPEVARPNAPLTVTLDTEGGSGGSAYATVAAVDEGILLLTKFGIPDPVEAVFGKARLGIDVYDDYGRILDPNTGEVGELRSGGDAIGGAGLSVVPTRTVALFEGPVNLDANGDARVTLDLPDFNGELRFMTVVWSESALGAAGAPLTVRDEVPAELILPRFLAPGDDALGTVTIDNVEGPPGAYTVTAESASQALSLPDGPLTVDLSQGERTEEAIPVVGRRTGVAEISLAVEGPEGSLYGGSYPIEIRSPFLPETRSDRFALAPGESWTPPGDLFAPYAEGSASLLLSASPTPIDVTTIVASLEDYPYACTEQLVSRATPWLYEAYRGPQGRASLRRAVETLLERQSADGSFGMWRVGDRQASPWLGAYATDFLARAKDAGAPVPDDALRRAYQALQPVSQGELARAYGYDSRVRPPAFSEDTARRLEDRSVAYALYVLTRGGVVDRSRLRYVHDARLEEIQSPLARAQIGAALAAIGDRSRADSAFAAARQALGYGNRGDWYQTRLRDQAAMIALLAEAERLDMATALYDKLASAVPEPDRLMTQEKAALVRASGALLGDRTEATVSYGDEEVSTIVLGAEDLTRFPFVNNGAQQVYITATRKGVPADPPAAASEGIAAEKAFLFTDGSPADLSALKQGDRLVVSVSVTPQQAARAQYVITDLLPAGLEIEAVLQPEDAGKAGPYSFLGELTEPDIAEARDDRYVASLAMQGTETRRFAYLVRATTPGNFAAPGVVAEDMYRPDVFGRSAPGRAVITP